MAENVYITGAEKGAFAEALDGLPEWATNETAEAIEKLLSKSLDVQTKTLTTLAKCCNKGGNAADTKKANDELEEFVKNIKNGNKELAARKKHWNEEEEEHRKQKKRWNDEKTGAAEMGAINAALIKAGAAVTGVLVENVNIFDLLYRSGITMVSGFDSASNGLESLQQMAALTGVRYTELAATMLKYSSAVNAFGAAKFAKTMTGASAELGKFGYTTKEAGDLLGAYLQTQSGYTDMNSKSQLEVQKNLVKFGERITRLSTATGIARDKLLQNIDAIAQTVEATILQGRTGAAAAESTMTFISSFKDQNLGQAFLRMMTDAIKPLNDTFMSFQKTGFGGFGQKLMEFTRSLEGLDPEEAKKRLAAFSDANKNEMDAMVKQANLLRQAGLKAESDDVLSKIAGIRKEARAYKEVKAEDRARMEATSAATKALQTSYEKLKSQLQATFYTLPEILDGLTWVLVKVNSLFDLVRSAVSSAETWVNSFETVTKQFGEIKILPIVAAMTVVVGLAAKFSILGKAISLFTGVLAASKWAINKLRGTTPPPAGGGGGGAGGGRGGRGGPPAGLAAGQFIGNLGKGIGTGIGGILQGLATGLSAFAKPQVVLGAAGLSASIAIIGTGIAAATWIMGKALPSFAEGLKAFDGISGENLISVAKGVGALGLAMVAFAAGTITSSVGSVIGTLAGGFSKLFGDGSVLDQLKAIAGLGPGLSQAMSAIGQVAGGVGSLSAALSAFTGLDTLKSIVSTINSINLLKAAAFAVLGKSGVSLPSPTTPVGVSVPTTPRASPVASPFDVSAGNDAPAPTQSKEPSKAVATGIERGPADTGINSMLGYQNTLLEQLLQSTNNLVSVNKDILKYTKVHS